MKSPVEYVLRRLLLEPAEKLDPRNEDSSSPESEFVLWGGSFAIRPV